MRYTRAMWIRALGGVPETPQANASCGAKAEGLARLAAAGLPVPEGFVLTDEAFQTCVGASALPRDVEGLGHALESLARSIEASEPPAAMAAALHERLAPFQSLAVRSSISLEDRGAGAAAGVYSSRLAVAPADVWPAIRAVWASVCTPLAAAYARHRGRDGAVAPLQVAVIIQSYVPGRSFTVYTREPGAPSSATAWLERDGALHKLPRTDENPALQLALRAEAALQLEATGADVELIEVPTDGGGAAHVIVQARPIIHPSTTPKVPAPPALVSALVADGRRWTADLAHNPDPLSPAQAGLIDRIEREGASPYALRLCGGYLYSTPREDTRPPPRPTSVEDLQRRFAAIEQRAAAALGRPTTELQPTLDAYLRFYRVWAHEMSPLVAAARAAGQEQAASRGAGGAPHPRLGTRRSAVDAIVLACARGEIGERELLDRIGDLAPAWDVAVPTLAETPEWIAVALSRARARGAGAETAKASSPARELTLAELAAELAELDDVWFAHAQARVRRALLARGEALALGADVFWLPLEDVVASVIDLEHARARASAARAAHRRASSWRVPAVVGGVAVPSPRWRGVGCGGVVSGRVVHLHHLWELPVLPLGAIAVTTAVTPALAVALVGAGAIVSETGGLLDHGAAMARELGIPCVVGCADAMSLPAHALVLVDGDAGMVTELEQS